MIIFIDIIYLEAFVKFQNNGFLDDLFLTSIWLWL